MDDCQTDPGFSLDALASWLELRIHEHEPWGGPAQLYGLTVEDAGALGRNADGAARQRLLACGQVYDLLDSPAAVMATMFDAIGLCCFGMATRLDTGARSRCRTVVVATERDQRSVNRMEGQHPELMGVPRGPVADRLDRLFDVLRSTEARPPT